MDETTKNLVVSVGTAWLRHAISGWGVWLVQAGLLKGESESAFEGAALVFAGLAWATWDKYGRSLVLKYVADLRGRMTSAKVYVPPAPTQVPVPATEVK